MNAADILHTLQDRMIHCYLDDQNPDWTVHFDYKDCAFIFDKVIFGWTLFNVGCSEPKGQAMTKEELVTLIKTI